MSASADDLRTLESEAGRRGVALAALLREAVEEKAQGLRMARRPRVGIARSTDGLSAADVASEPIADAPR